MRQSFSTIYDVQSRLMTRVKGSYTDYCSSFYDFRRYTIIVMDFCNQLNNTLVYIIDMALHML